MTLLITPGDIIAACVALIFIVGFMVAWLLAFLGRRAKYKHAEMERRAQADPLAHDRAGAYPRGDFVDRFAAEHCPGDATLAPTRTSIGSDPSPAEQDFRSRGRYTELAVIQGLDNDPATPGVKRCVEGGPLHNFSPRYSESSVPVVFRNLNLRTTKAVDLARLIEAQTTRVKAYQCDVCVWCGKSVNHQAPGAVAMGPNGERVIEVQVEGGM